MNSDFNNKHSHLKRFTIDCHLLSLIIKIYNLVKKLHRLDIIYKI